MRKEFFNILRCAAFGISFFLASEYAQGINLCAGSGAGWDTSCGECIPSYGLKWSDQNCDSLPNAGIALDHSFLTENCSISKEKMWEIFNNPKCKFGYKPAPSNNISSKPSLKGK